MMRIALSLAALAVIFGFGVRPGEAQTTGEAPWCAVMEIGNGAIERDCQYWTVQECVPHVIAGNRGFCNVNPYWRGPVPTAPVGPGPHPRRHRHYPPPR